MAGTSALEKGTPLAFAVGVLAWVAFLAFFYAPLIGTVYRAFGLPGPR